MIGQRGAGRALEGVAMSRIASTQAERRSRRTTLRLAAVLLAACALATATRAQAADDNTVTIVSWGGTTQDAERASVWQPIAKELGITIKEDTISANSDIKAHVDSGANTWDIVDIGSGSAVDFAKQGLLEPLDYKVIDTKGIDPRLAQPYWVGWYYFSTVLAWNKDAFKGAQPTGWADFWDTKKFPGPRSLRNDIFGTLAFALLADGVPVDKLYPLDIDRAFRKLEEIRPAVKVWWQSGSQSVQLITSGEVNFISLWNARALVAAQTGNVGFTYNQGELDFETLVIPKGAPHAALAQKVISRIISAKLQASFAKALHYGPVNEQAFADGLIPADDAKLLPSSPENKKVQAVLDPSWWLEHQADVTERFQNFLQK
jgi:putative spermidine/putrescine transport system substrate-binding protein